MKLEAGAVVAGRYRLERCLGEGGMGTVWAVMHLVTQRRHAIKFVKANIHGRDDAFRRFLREARAASAVDHPNLVRVHDVFDLDDGTPVMVMDFLEGETLGSLLRRKPELALDETAAVMIPVMSAVGTAHGAGVVHRDLKPDNIFLEAQPNGVPTIRVLDFGIAKLTTATGEGENITETGALLGTPAYMSPEQSFGERDIDHRTDIYALGVILFECLAGSRPVEGENLGQVMRKLISGEIRSLAAVKPDLPSDITALVTGMLSRDRDQRPSDLAQPIAVLEKYTSVTAPRFGTPGSIVPSVPDLEYRSSPKVVIPGTGSYDSATVKAPSATSQDTQGPTFVSISQRRPPRAGYVAIAAGVAVAMGASWFLLNGKGGSSSPEGVAASSTQASASPKTEVPNTELPQATSAASAGPVPSAAPETERGVPAGISPAPAKVSIRTTTARPKSSGAAPAAAPAPGPAGSDPAKRSKGLIDEPPF